MTPPDPSPADRTPARRFAAAAAVLAGLAGVGLSAGWVRAGGGPAAGPAAVAGPRVAVGAATNQDSPADLLPASTLIAGSWGGTDAAGGPLAATAAYQSLVDSGLLPAVRDVARAAFESGALADASGYERKAL